MFMNKLQMRDAYAAGKLYLKSQVLLADLCCRHGVLRWKLRPKLHYLDHQVEDIRLYGWNPKFWECWMDEDFMGKIALLSGKCPATNTALRTILRYIVLFWARARKRKRGETLNSGAKRVRIA